MRVLVLAAPRSGTRYFAALLRAAGLDVGHERFGADGCVSSYMVVEGPITHGRHAQAGETRADAKPDQVWRLLRHPLDTIGSIASGMHRSWWRWQERFTDVHPEREPAAERAARFWLCWQHRMDRDMEISLTIPVEEAEIHWPEIAQRLAVDSTFPRIDRIGHAPRSERLDLAHIETSTRQRVLAQMARHGYQENE